MKLRNSILSACRTSSMYNRGWDCNAICMRIFVLQLTYIDNEYIYLKFLPILLPALIGEINFYCIEDIIATVIDITLAKIYSTSVMKFLSRENYWLQLQHLARNWASWGQLDWYALNYVYLIFTYSLIQPQVLFPASSYVIIIIHLRFITLSPALQAFPAFQCCTKDTLLVVAALLYFRFGKLKLSNLD